MVNIKIVLLAGGKGTRLWPISTDDMPKQFLKIYGDDTMIEKIYNDLCSLYNKEDIYIATNDEYRLYLEQILPSFVNYIIEPKSNGTYSAVLNIAAHLKYKDNINETEMISILPIDSYVNKDFFNVFEMVEEKYKDTSSICLIGIKPNCISTQYGYIVHHMDKVLNFKEKPDYDEAFDLVNSGALWNSGIFIASLCKLFSLIKNIKTYDEFISKYLEIPKGSFDVNVLEKEKNLLVITSYYSWCDIGIWENLAPLLTDSDQYNNNIINYEDKKIVTSNIKNTIIVNSQNGIKLIKKNNIYIKKWGNYEVLNNYSNKHTVKIKKLNIFPNKNISYQYHHQRNEEMIILKGEGEFLLNGKLKKIKSGDKLSIGMGDKHSIRASSLIEIIEIQFGIICDEEDIVRLEDNWEQITKNYVIVD